MDIGPGDWLEALCDGAVCGVIKGAIYCVSEVGEPHDCPGCGRCFGVNLVGVPTPAQIGLVAPDRPNMWAACEFRPVPRPKSDVVDVFRRNWVPARVMLWGPLPIITASTHI